MEQLCQQCPRCCRIVRAAEYKTGGVLPGVCHAPAQPVVARAGLHHWEEPVISGNQGSGTVFFSGCNLNCVYCQNYNISSGVEGKPITVERLRDIYRELIELGAHNINLVTPTHYSEVILQSLNDALPVPVVYNTNSYDQVAMLKKFSGKVQIYLADYKYIDNTLGKRYSGVNDYAEKAWDAIEEMYRQTGPYVIDDNGIMQKGVIIRHLILPGAIANTVKIIRRIAERFAPGEVLFSLMRQYLPCGQVNAENYPELNRTVTDEEYEIVEEALYSSTIEDGFVQDESAASGDFIPVFDNTGV